jgi:hypothetical protein
MCHPVARALILISISTGPDPLFFWWGLPGIEPAPKIAVTWGNVDLTTRNYAKRRESSWEYAGGVDGINTARRSVMTLLIASANRDDRQFGSDAEMFNIHRQPRSHIAFAVGVHFCLGAALARLEGRIALEEILKRFPSWDVDLSAARMSTTSTVRGWETMPALIRE